MDNPLQHMSVLADLNREQFAVRVTLKIETSKTNSNKYGSNLKRTNEQREKKMKRKKE